MSASKSCEVDPQTQPLSMEIETTTMLQTMRATTSANNDGDVCSVVTTKACLASEPKLKSEAEATPQAAPALRMVDDDSDDAQVVGTEIAKKSKMNAHEDENGMRRLREDRAMDRRIIEGMLQNRNEFMQKMQREGFTEALVLRRAAELGLSEASIRQATGVAADLAGERPGNGARRHAPSSYAARVCLSCDRVFFSAGPGNRMCTRCRGGDAGLAQL